MSNSHIYPPTWITRFFKWYCNDSLHEYLEGDLLELYQRRFHEQGKVYAQIDYVLNVLDLIRPFTLRKDSSFYSHTFIYSDMFIHNIKAILRNLKRNYTHTIINVLGITLALLCTTIIFVKIHYDLNFDRHFPEAENMYRVVGQSLEHESYFPTIPGPFSEVLQNEVPEINMMTIIDRNQGSTTLSFLNSESQRQIVKEDVALVWSNHFSLFKYDWISGNPATAFSTPNSIVVTRDFALKHFNTLDIIDYPITYNDERELLIKGIVDNHPPNTNFPFEVIVAAEKDQPLDWLDNWGAFSFSWQCYIKLHPQTDVVLLEKKINDLFKQKTENEDLMDINLMLQPIKDIHLDERFYSFSKAPVSVNTLRGLGFIGIFILISACINFINLNTALIFNRSQEMGIRKILGGKKSQIFRLFMGETGLIVLMSAIVSFLLLPQTMRILSTVFGETLTMESLPFQEWTLFMVGLLILTIYLAGYYPATILARISPVLAMKPNWNVVSGKKVPLSKGLITLQFAISQVLIICMLIAMSQMIYFQSAPLGFNKEAIVEVPLHEDRKLTLEENLQNVALFKEQLLQVPSISHVSFSNTGAASDNYWSYSYSFSFADSSITPKTGNAQIKFVDEHYLDTYEMKLMVGENLQASDTGKYVLVNRTLAEQLMPDAIHTLVGMPLGVGGKRHRIVGVVNDFKSQSLHKPIGPLIISNDLNNVTQAAVKIKGGIAETLPKLELIWSETFPKEVYEYAFLDETIEQFYETERRTTRLFQLSAGIAIFIGCLGLLGLISFMAAKRTKEIGIRKVLGATVIQILGLFTREFVYLVIIGFVIAAPLSYYIMQNWLEDFHYRIDIHAGYFVMGMLVSLIFMGLVVGIKSYKSANMNPVDAIRNE